MGFLNFDENVCCLSFCGCLSGVWIVFCDRAFFFFLVDEMEMFSWYGGFLVFR